MQAYDRWGKSVKNNDIFDWKIRVQGRAAQSVRIMNVKAGDEVAAAAPCSLDIWPKSIRPGEGSSCGPSARDIR